MGDAVASSEASLSLKKMPKAACNTLRSALMVCSWHLHCHGGLHSRTVKRRAELMLLTEGENEPILCMHFSVEVLALVRTVRLELLVSLS